MMKTISTEKLKSKLDQGHPIALLDVRGDEDFDKEHLPGAMAAPLGYIGEGIACCLVKGAEIIVYCGSTECTASEEGVKRLQDMGFTNVMRYKDGIKGWKDAGLPTMIMQMKRKAA